MEFEQVLFLNFFRAVDKMAARIVKDLAKQHGNVFAFTDPSIKYKIVHEAMTRTNVSISNVELTNITNTQVLIRTLQQKLSPISKMEFLTGFFAKSALPANVTFVPKKSNELGQETKSNERRKEMSFESNRINN
jgi:hypothetical protein